MRSGRPISTSDALGRRTSLTLPSGLVTEYAYDAASQLTGITYKYAANTLGNLTYAYDDAGRRTTIGGTYARTGLTPTVATASYNAANQQTAFGSQNLTYDLNGNLTSDGTNTYVWNGRDQLASMTGPGLTASFQYDAFGNRISKTINGNTNTYLYDGANLVQEQSGGSPSANMLAGALDEVFTRADAGGAWSPLSDGLGSTLALADSTGTVQTQYTYEPFGKTATSGSSTGNTSQFTGRENDGTGLYYYRARYYSPSLQRFVSEDPIGVLGGINLYGYVDNNPISYSDPYGLKPDDPQKSEPTYLDTLFGDGGVFTRPTFEEFISAKERARQPCKPFGERWLDSFSETNKAIPGFAAPIGTTLITSPGAAQLTGQPGVLGYALRGGGPGLGGAIVQSGLVAIATHASFEGGIAVGSYANAIGAPCGY